MRAALLPHLGRASVMCLLRGAAAGFYRRHSDAQNSSRRVLTAIYYVNPSWSAADGGQLRLWLPSGAELDIEPIADRLVLFSSHIEHEVLPLGGAEALSDSAGGDSARLPHHERPPRCAVTQWFQDLAPPYITSGLWSFG